MKNITLKYVYVRNNEYIFTKDILSMSTVNTSITRETLPMYIGVKDAVRMGITRNSFYTLTHRDNDFVVEIGGRVYLDRDNLLAWLDQGGDKKNNRKDKE